jgi:hypothetical protein
MTQKDCDHEFETNPSNTVRKCVKCGKIVHIC